MMPLRPGKSGWLRRHRTALIVVVLIILAALFTIYILHRRAGRKAEAPAEAAIVTAQTGVARVTTFEVMLAVLGTVQPRPGYAASVAAPAATRVARVLVAPGDHVLPGQPLVELDTTILAAQTREARATLTAARQTYDRAARLVAEGILPRKDLEAAAADLTRAQAALLVAERTQTLAVLRSPIAGIVTKVLATLSRPVDISQPLVEIVNPVGLEILFHLSPADAARVAAGDAVELTAEEGSTRSILGQGVVRGVSAAVDSTGAVDARATISLPARPLKVGETISGRIVVAVHHSAVVVPIAALVPGDTGLVVFTVDTASIAHMTPVTVGGRTETEAEILSGLRGGEVIVTEGAYGVTDGARIQRGLPQ